MSVKGILPSVMLIVSVAINLFQAYTIDQMRKLVSPKQLQFLKVGSVAPSFGAVDLTSNSHTVEYGNTTQPTVLYVFTPGCSWCARNADNFRELIARRKDDYRFIGISLTNTGLAQYVAEQRITIPVYSGLSSDTTKAYVLGPTPETIVIGPNGRVIKNWVGAYAGPHKTEVEAFVGIQLPGLRVISEAAH